MWPPGSVDTACPRPPAFNSDLWPFDLETGMWVASKMGNLHSEFGHARPLGSQVISSVRDGQMDGHSDRKSNAAAPSLWVGRNNLIMSAYLACAGALSNHIWLAQVLTMLSVTWSKPQPLITFKRRYIFKCHQRPQIIEENVEPRGQSEILISKRTLLNC